MEYILEDIVYDLSEGSDDLKSAYNLLMDLEAKLVSKQNDSTLLQAARVTLNHGIQKSLTDDMIVTATEEVE